MCSASSRKHKHLANLVQGNNFVYVLPTCRETKSSSRSPITLYWEQDKAPSSHFGQAPEGSAEYARRQAAWDSDPVRTVQLTTHVAHSLQEAERTLGGPQALEEIISRADPLVTQQIRTELARQ
jgi:hypothetical protein